MSTFTMCSRVLKNISSLNTIALYRNRLSGSLWKPMSTTATESTTKDTESPPAGAGTEGSSDKPEDELKTQMKELKKQLEDMEDKYKRSIAEMQNVRTRMQKQIDDAKVFGIQSFCKDLLDVADILGKATESVPPEELSGANNPHLNNLFQGLTMTESELLKVFKKNGLCQINPVGGDKFDPNFHEALFQQQAEGKEAGTVAVTTKIGYKLHERTLRPALVGVFK